MTANEIVTGLKCLSGEHIFCMECKYFCSTHYEKCYREVPKDALDLINRQKRNLKVLKNRCDNAKAEIERLSDRNHKCIYLSDDETTEYCVDGPCPKFKTETEIKAEAIKEFVERLKGKACRISVSYKGEIIPERTEYHIGEVEINNLVKEMVGDVG